MRRKHGLAAGALLALLLWSWPAAAKPTVMHPSELEPVQVKIRRRSTKGLKLAGGEPLQVRIKGPGRVSARVFRKLPRRRPRRARRVRVVFRLDGKPVARAIARPRRSRARIAGGQRLGRPTTARFRVPRGEHTLQVSLPRRDRFGAVVTFNVPLQAVVESEPAATADTSKEAAEPAEQEASTASAAAKAEDEVAEAEAETEKKAASQASASATAAAASDGQVRSGDGDGAEDGGSVETASASTGKDGAQSAPADAPTAGNKDGANVAMAKGSSGSQAEVASTSERGQTEVEVVAAESVDAGPQAVGTAPASALGSGGTGTLGVDAGLRLGAYHGAGANQLGAAFAVGGEARVDLPLLPASFGQLGAAVSGSWFSFSTTQARTDPVLGDYESSYRMDLIPITAEAIYELPQMGPVVVYGGAAFALYVALSRSEAFGDVDARTVALPAFQAFGALGIPLGPATLALEVRYTNVNINFQTGTIGSGAGMFGQAVARFALY